MISMQRILLSVLLIAAQPSVCNSFSSNNFRLQQSGATRVKADFESLVQPKRPSRFASSTTLHSVYASSGVPEGIDAKVGKFRPGPEISIGSLKLNWYGTIFGIIGVSLGFVWWASLAAYQGFQSLTRQKFDRQRRVPVEFGHLWGTIVLRLTNCYPVISGKKNLKAIYKRDKETKKRKPVMFVANHASWMDIYYVGISLGWHNYKMVAKSELLSMFFSHLV
mmetsp:Transcript_16099/g.39429  ORF Transcript_16099/g.39429 Transcript_16099/m.39429 type:complete len:222 (+) Transcript_16099:129-794(+)